jgi:DNA helicase IV
MQQDLKDKILKQTREHISSIRQIILDTISRREAKGLVMKKNSGFSLWAGDVFTQAQITANNEQQIENLKQLYPSPYFTRCELEIDGEKKVMYFAKFSFSDQQIYSWVSPAATLRFENPGSASYTRPDGTVQSGIMLKKDQYMIVDGKLLFFSTEGMGQSRELVYQEHFTRQKAGFILPEVVELMEKAQDQIVRAPYQGPFLISGPAGSGKTTMALHRVAYLMQSPETAQLFAPESTLVLVQDKGTKEYFSHLLPELGIRGVEIITFAEWAMSILELQTTCHIVVRYGTTEQERDLYEYSKLTALRQLEDSIKLDKNIWVVLQKVYKDHFTENQEGLFAKQQKERGLDRFDLTILLSVYYQTHGQFNIIKDYYQELTSGKYRKKRAPFKVEYNLTIIDEFQNYLPEQLSLLKHCLNYKLESVVYVGDMAQQTQLGTIRDWKSINETIQTHRLVKLEKVYRNTKQILAYIANLGYPVQIPQEVKEGKPVVEYITHRKEDEIAQLHVILASLDSGTVGVLAKDKEYLEAFKKEFVNNSKVHCLSMQEAQGVEFEVVCLVGISQEPFSIDELPQGLIAEVKKVQRDLLYVALTRAMSELHIMGTTSLKSICEAKF